MKTFDIGEVIEFDSQMTGKILYHDDVDNRYYMEFKPNYLGLNSMWIPAIILLNNLNKKD